MTFTKLPKAISAEELLSTPLPPVKWIIPGLLPAGLALFAGPSKAGKSWLALWLCLQIAQGNPVWNREMRHFSIRQTAADCCGIQTTARQISLIQPAGGHLRLAETAVRRKPQGFGAHLAGVITAVGQPMVKHIQMCIRDRVHAACPLPESAGPMVAASSSEPVSVPIKRNHSGNHTSM